MLAPKHETGIQGYQRVHCSGGTDGSLSIYITQDNPGWPVPVLHLLGIPFNVGGAQLDRFMGILFVHICEVLIILKAEKGKGIKNCGSDNIGQRNYCSVCRLWPQLG